MVVAAGHVVHPLLVVEVPTDGALDAFFKLQRRLPAKFVVQLARVDGIAQVVPLAVGDVSYQVHVLTLLAAKQAVDGVYQHLDDVDVLPFVETANVVGVGNLALVEYQVDGSCVILDI